MVKYKMIKMMLALVAQFDWEVEQIYVNIAFLHGELEELICIKQT